MMNPSRVVILTTLSLAIGIYLTKVYSIAFYVSIPLIILSFVLFIYFLYAKKTTLCYAFLFISIFSIGCILTRSKDVQISEKQISIRNGKKVFLKGVVLEPPDFSEKSIRIKVKILQINKNHEIEKKKIIINGVVSKFNIEAADCLKPGYVIEFSGVIRKLEPPTNPGEFDRQWYLYLNGISGVVFITQPDKIKIINTVKINPILNMVYNIRSGLKLMIDKSLPYPESTVLTGILLGRRKELPPSSEKIFKNTGTLHVLAASGLHISILIASMLLLFKLTGFHSRFSYLFIIPAVLLYMLTAGVSPSIMRASIMGIIFLIASCIGKDYHYINSLFIAGFIMLVINPYNLFLPGFQFSFIIVLGILIFYRPIIGIFPDHEKIRRYLKKQTTVSISVITSVFYRLCISILVISVIAQLVIIPMSAFYFNRISLVNIPSNFIVVPLSSILIPVGFIGGIVSMINEGMGETIIYLLHIPLSFSIKALTFLGNFSFSTIPLPSPTPVEIKRRHGNYHQLGDYRYYKD